MKNTEIKLGTIHLGVLAITFVLSSAIDFIEIVFSSNVFRLHLLCAIGSIKNLDYKNISYSDI